LTKVRNRDGNWDKFTYYPSGRLETATTFTDMTEISILIRYTFTWSSDGLLQSVLDNTNNRTISYTEYDGIGQRKTVDYFGQWTVGYDYDSANLPAHITYGANTFTFGYDSLGRRSLLTYPNQTKTSYSYDDLDRLTNISHKAGTTEFAKFAYTDFDKVGNRKARSTVSQAETYVYDIIYRLLQTVAPAGTEEFHFDEVGNRTSGPGAKDTGYLHDNGNRMTQGRKLAYGYDDAGNQTVKTAAPDKTWVQSWDAENRLVKVEKTKGSEKRTVSFKYDPFGRRIGKQLTTVIDGVTKTSAWNYAYDNEDIVLETLAVNGTTTSTTRYIHGPGIDEPLALERGGQVYCYHADGLGSIAAITDQNKNIVQSYRYDSFGMVTPGTQFENSYAYTAREWDRETGLYYYRARYYDPMDGRFISKDPIGFEGGDVNLFGMTSNDPINWVDPNGLKSMMVRSLPAAGGFAAGDGPLPIGDIIAGSIIVGAGLYDLMQNWGNSSDEPDNSPDFRSKTDDECGRKEYQPDKPGRKKQGRENREGKRQDPKKWKPRNPPKEPPRHTPSRKD